MPNVFAFLQSPAQNPVQPAQVEVTQAAMQVAAQSAPQIASMAPPPAEAVAQTTSPAPAGQQQAAAEQTQPVQEATASIDAPKPHVADAKHHDKAGSQKAANLTKTKIPLAGKPDAAPEGAASGQQQAAAEQTEPVQDATASIDAPKPYAADAKHHDKADLQKAAKLAKTKIAHAGQASAAPEGVKVARQQAAAEQTEPVQDATASIDAPKPHAADAKHRDKADLQKAAKLAKTKIALAGKADSGKAVPQAPHKMKEARAHAISTASQASDAEAGPTTGSESPAAERPSAATESGGAF